MMYYKFPEIRHISDVLPHIDGRTEFIVAERPYGSIINYVVAFPDTFDISDKNFVSGAIRRECRGLIFDLSGNLISRPFHKFFNLNEREETQLHQLDFYKNHEIFEKLDGSMIRPLLIDSKVRLGTKMGLTDVGEQAEAFMSPLQAEWFEEQIHLGYTPITEFISPENRIVVRYQESELVLTALRHNAIGVYVELPKSSPFRIVPSYGTITGDTSEYVKKVKSAIGREGDIVRFSNGHMIKLKAEDYVRIHNIKDKIQSERNIAEIIINEKLDDILPDLDEEDTSMVLEYQERFKSAFNHNLERLKALCETAKNQYGGDKKNVALNMIPTLEHNEDARFIFSVLDGKDLRDLVLQKIRGDVGNTTKYDSMCTWIGLKVKNA